MKENINENLVENQDFLVCKSLQKYWPNCSVDFSCSVPKGKTLVLFGHSGSGKSTVLQMISGLVPPDNVNDKENPAKIFIDSTDCSNLHPAKRNVGMVFQSAVLFPHLRVDDNVAYGLRCKGFSKKESRKMASEFLAKFNLDGFSTRSVNSLSGGEAQRVSLARTLIVKPSLILFDEPFSALDKPLAKTLVQDIKQAQQEQKFTSVLVTHDREEAKFLGDFVIKMEKGNILWQGSIEEF
jgi:ABC-type Fe3+/spermidine/putrescine transport system ATPase subunit